MNIRKPRDWNRCNAILDLAAGVNLRGPDGHVTAIFELVHRLFGCVILAKDEPEERGRNGSSDADSRCFRGELASLVLIERNK